MKRALGLGGLLLLLALGGWLLVRPSSGPSRPVTEAEARAHLDELVTAGQARDFDTLCKRLADATFNCERTVADAGEGAVPSQPPRLVSAVYHPGSEGSVGGWVLTVEGIDGKGKRYRTEVLIFRDEGRVLATNAVYWYSARIDFGDPNGAVSPDV